MRTGSFRPGGGSVEGGRGFAVSESSWGSDGDGGLVGGPGLVGSLWRDRLVVVVVAALAAVAGYAVSLVVPPGMRRRLACTCVIRVAPRC